MNALVTGLVRSEVGLSRSEVTETDTSFTVRTKAGGPMLGFALLFGVPGVALVIGAIRSPSALTLVPALVFGPFLLGLAVLSAASIVEKRFDKTQRQLRSRLTVLGAAAEETVPVPSAGRVGLKTENRGSAGGGASIRFVISVERCTGAGFVVYRDYAAARAFAERLTRFLGLTLEDTVAEHYRASRE